MIVIWGSMSWWFLINSIDKILEFKYNSSYLKMIKYSSFCINFSNI